MKTCMIALGCLVALAAPAVGEVVFCDGFDGTGYDHDAWEDVATLQSQLQWDCSPGSTVTTSVADGLATFSGDGGSAWDYGRALVSDAAFAAPTGTDYYVYTADLAVLNGTLGVGHQFIAGIGILDGGEPNGWSVEGSVLHAYAYADVDGFIAEVNYRDETGRHMGNGGAPPANGPGVLTMIVAPDAITFSCDGAAVYRYAPLPSGSYDTFRIAIYGAARVGGDSVHASFDSVSLALVPEPATVALMLVGCAAGFAGRAKRS